jgi:hypothetical protein
MLISLPTAPGQRARQVTPFPPTASAAKLVGRIAFWSSRPNGKTRDTYSRRPPLAKKARAA